MELTRKEKWLIDVLKAVYKTRTNLIKQESAFYNSYLRKARYILDAAFPIMANKNKELLLTMAKNNEDKPKWDTKLGRALSSYIGKTHGSYDPEFNKQIRKLAPQWFIDTASENKEVLLKMAKNNEARPKQVTKLGSALSSYISKTKSGYDPEFDKTIRELAPHWFIDTASENKQLLLTMAGNGEDRPKKATKLGQALSSYINKTHRSYDPEFDKTIRKLAPHWFENRQEKQKRQSFEKMLKVMPKDLVSFKKGQEWKGTMEKYIFVCKKHGEFESTPNSLMQGSWKKGLSGHPKMGKEKMGQYKARKVLCHQTGITYESLSEAARKLNIDVRNICSVLSGRQKQTKGYTFKYVD